MVSELLGRSFDSGELGSAAPIDDVAAPRIARVRGLSQKGRGRLQRHFELAVLGGSGS